MKKIILIRHGESVWNKKNIFTGWTDVGLSKKGVLEAQKTGLLLKKKKIFCEYAYTSVLKRSIYTLWYILEKLNLLWINIFKTWKLNERHYGALQGKNKQQTTEIYGERKVLEWRRSYKISPPKITPKDDRYPGKEKKYKQLKKHEIPLGESLLDTFNRVIPYWENHILPNIQKQNYSTVLLVAHGNSLRALIKHIENISDKDITNLDIPTAKPIVYEYTDSMKFNNKYVI